MNPSSIVRFHWYETFAFARARAGSTPPERSLAATALFAVLLAVTLPSAGFPESPQEGAVLLAIALGSALLISYGLIPLVSRLPNDIHVTTESFVIGRTSIPFANVEHAVVGSTRIADRDFPVLTFKERTGQVHLYGLSRKVSPHELAAFLERVGLREPQA